MADVKEKLWQNMFFLSRATKRIAESGCGDLFVCLES